MKKHYSLGINWPNLPFHPFSKKLQKTFLTLLLLLCVGFVNAQSFVVNGLQYTVTTGQEVSVNKDGICPTGALTIPSLVTNAGIEYTVRSIESNAFQSCSGLTSVTFGDSLTSIANSTFFDCSGLTSVTFGNSLTSIGGQAFRDCSALSSLTLPNSLTSIGNSVFRGCNGLTSITLPNSLTSIGIQAFFGCIGLTSVTFGNSLTSIGNGAFEFCSALTSVTLPNSLTSIAGSAFFGCSGLTSVTLGDSLTSIASSAFFGCSGLTSVTLPDSLTSIGVNAFFGCSGLTSLTLPNSLTSIGNFAFQNCSGLTSVTLPNSLTSIADFAFYQCSGLTSLTLPNSLTTIGTSAFSQCSGLTSVTFGDSLTNIGGYAFSNCTGLSSLTLPNSLTSIADFAFQNCTSLEEVIVAWDTPITITTNVFNGLTLSGITLKVPEGKVATYEAAAVWQDFSPIEEDIVCFTIGDLQYCEIDSANVRVTKADACPTGALTIPSLVTFEGTQYTVRTIEANAFEDCSGLTSVTLGDSLTSIGNFAFYQCSGLTSVVIGDSLTSIAGFAFSGCSALTSLTLPNSLTSIGESAFESCSGLTSLTLPNSLTSIGVSAFESCSGLTSLTLPNSLTTIENLAFLECSGLTSVTLPNSLTSIGGAAFANCSVLTEVTVSWQTPLVISSDVFFGLTLSNITLKVPEGEIATYEAAAVWTDFSPISAVHNLTETACGNFEFGDSTYTVSGMYNDTITTTENNDSILRLNLTILQIPVTNLTESACASFTFADSTYTTSGNYTDTLTAMAANGCDSIVNLDLTILEILDTTQLQEMACGSFTFGDSTYMASGTYSETLMAANGCDSIVNLDLTILESTSSSVTLSQEGSISWNGVVYNQSIDTTITLVNAVGCDSIVSLSITIIPSDVFFTQVLEICDGEMIEVGSSVYSGAGTFIDTLSTQNGCCDSIVTTTVVLLSPIATPIVSLPLALTLETTQGYESYQWRKDGTEIDGATSYQYNVTEAGSYQVEVSNDDGCTALSAPYNLGTSDISESLLGRFMVYPNPTSSNATIQIPFGEEFNMEITNVLGEIVLKQELVNTETTLETSRLNKGIYFINLFNEKGNQTLRFVKN